MSLTDYNSSAKQESNMKLATHSEMDVHYQRKVTPSALSTEGHTLFRNCTTSALVHPNMDGVR